MQVVVNIKSHASGHEQVKSKKKRWINKEISLKINILTELSCSHEMQLSKIYKFTKSENHWNVHVWHNFKRDSKFMEQVWGKAVVEKIQR